MHEKISDHISFSKDEVNALEIRTEMMNILQINSTRLYKKNLNIRKDHTFSFNEIVAFLLVVFLEVSQIFQISVASNFSSFWNVSRKPRKIVLGKKKNCHLKMWQENQGWRIVFFL